MGKNTGNKKGSKEEYLNVWDYAKNYDHSKILKEINDYFGFIYDKDEMDELGLYLQICIKKSRPMYLHGYVLTSALNKYIENNDLDNFIILETGTARGFSSLCMAKILEKFNKEGSIYTIDIENYNNSQYWNCILDDEGKHTKPQLLDKWGKTRDRYLKFKMGDSKNVLNELNLDRIHFSFLDARHNYEYVKMEIDFVQNKQISGDVIVCDDYTESQYPGIVKAIDEFLEKGLYNHKIFYGNDGTKKRGYVYMIKK
jgi:hypothetical protein